MPTRETLGFRDETFSLWHRPDSLERFTPSRQRAIQCPMIDADYIMWIMYRETRRPVAIIETAEWKYEDQEKTATVVAAFAGLIRPEVQFEAWVVLYKLDPDRFLRNEPGLQVIHDIKEFKVRQVYPTIWCKWQTMTPKQWAHEEQRMRGMYGTE